MTGQGSVGSGSGSRISLGLTGSLPILGWGDADTVAKGEGGNTEVRLTIRPWLTTVTHTSYLDRLHEVSQFSPTQILPTYSSLGPPAVLVPSTTTLPSTRRAAHSRTTPQPGVSTTRTGPVRLVMPDQTLRLTPRILSPCHLASRPGWTTRALHRTIEVA